MRINSTVTGGATTPLSYQLIALDVDGTLMDSSGLPSKGVEEAMKSAQAQGIQVVLVSGRGMQGMLPLLKSFNLEGPFIASGGAVIAEAPCGDLIDLRPIPLRYAFELARLGRLARVAVVFEHPQWMLTQTEGKELQNEASQYLARLKVVKDLTEETPSAPTKVTMIGDASRFQEIIRVVKEEKLPLNYVQTSPKYLDFHRKGVNKGSAVKRLARHLNVPLKNVMAVGDYYNDIDMFKVTGFSIAMGNAPSEVRQAADLVAPGNDEGGAAWAIAQAIYSGTTG